MMTRLLRRCWVIWTNWQTARQVEKAKRIWCEAEFMSEKGLW